MVDRSNMFEDFNFKLVVINAILREKSSFEEKLMRLKKQYVDKYEWYCGHGLIPEMVDFFEELCLTPEDLDKVKRLYFDGGEDIYALIQPDWDGEDDIFDVTSVKGYERLKNLESVIYTSMCEEVVLEPFKEILK